MSHEARQAAPKALWGEVKATSVRFAGGGRDREGKGELALEVALITFALTTIC